MLEKSLRGHVHSSKVDGGVFIAMMSKKMATYIFEQIFISVFKFYKQ